MAPWPFRPTAAPAADPTLPRLSVRAMREDRGRFAALRDARVLMYWPHGLGDWATFSTIAPLLEPSNAYAIVRFGDDYVSFMEGHPTVAPLTSGVRAPGDGAERGARHLGLTLAACRGDVVDVALPPPLDAAVRSFEPQVLLWSDYAETEGRVAYPYHTKARNLARALVAPDRLARFDLGQPLRSSADFSVPPATQRALDARLAGFAAPGSRIAILSRTGFTAARKTWGDGSEAAAFVAALQRTDARWRFISMDDEVLGAGVAGFRALFGDLDQPFARAFKALLTRADLFVGVPAGPLHVTLARGGVPTVGLWLAHHPDWYDEPNRDAIHLVGNVVRARNFHRRPATTTKPPALQHRLVYLATETIGASDVASAAEALLRNS